MKKDEVPQDKSNLASANMREIYYAVDKDGQYTTALSTGWEPKTIALDKTIDLLKEREEEAKSEIRAGVASPILFFMEVSRMEVSVLAEYVGLWQWRVKRHLKVNVFKKLNDKILTKYANAFGISLEALKNYNPDK